MRLAVLERPHEFAVIDEPIPAIAPNEVLLRVGACGVCASELDMFAGLVGHADYPWYPGHEVAGTVEHVGEEVRSLAPGDSVAAWVTVRGYSEYVAVRAEHCFDAGDAPPEVALGEPLGCAVNAVELAGIKLGDDVVIIGAGFMGHLVHKLVQLRGPRQVIVADVRQDALKRAEAFGASRTVDVTRESLVDAVEDATRGTGADVVLEVTGAQTPLEAAGAVARMSGTVAIVGYHQGEPRSIPLGAWNWMAFKVVNAHFRDVSTILGGMRAGMRLLTSGRISLEELVTHRFDLDDIDSAFRTAIDKPDGFVKATVIP
jgi:threonine dehydrogenase-like Zn-dependent dehydrogenase